jgi:transcriptional regulator ATRX
MVQWKKKSINDKWLNNRFLNGEKKILLSKYLIQFSIFRVIDDHQLDRHFTQNDIQELYKFQPEKLPDAQTTSTPLNFNYAIPKDHLLLDLLYEHNRWIHSYHSHDSLLENKIDEGLTADERRRGSFRFFFYFFLVIYFPLI